jgi:uncharacterized protein (TIGR03086 family)
MSQRNPAELYAASTGNTMKILKGVRNGQLGDRTPCSEWNVRDLIMHCIGGQQFAAGMLSGKPTGIEFGGIGTLEPITDDVAAMVVAYQHSIDGVLATADNSAAMERIIELPIGTFSGLEFMSTEFMDQLVHGWDLAIATGQDATLEPALAEAAHALFLPGGHFGSGGIGETVVVPETATNQEKLLAAVGRNPAQPLG